MRESSAGDTDLRREVESLLAFLDRLRAMQREIAVMRADAPDALRALLYETLVLLNRWYALRHLLS